MSEGGTDVVAKVSDLFGHAIVPRCRDQGCRIGCAKLPRHAILKGEILVADRPMCDCVIVIDSSPVVVALVELRSRSVDATKVVKKLQNATAVATQIMARIGLTDYVLAHMVLARGWRTSEYRVLTSNSVAHLGRHYHILPRRCGCELNDVLKVFGHTV